MMPPESNKTCRPSLEVFLTRICKEREKSNIPAECNPSTKGGLHQASRKRAISKLLCNTIIHKTPNAMPVMIRYHPFIQFCTVVKRIWRLR